MVIKIHQACSTKNALLYNERKVERQKAIFYYSQNMPVANPFRGDKNDRYRIFQEIEVRNTRVKKPGLHISMNPTVSDLVRLGDAGIRNEISKLMEHPGYGISRTWSINTPILSGCIFISFLRVSIVIPVRRLKTITKGKRRSALSSPWSRDYTKRNFENQKIRRS